MRRAWKVKRSFQRENVSASQARAALQENANDPQYKMIENQGRSYKGRLGFSNLVYRRDYTYSSALDDMNNMEHVCVRYGRAFTTCSHRCFSVNEDNSTDGYTDDDLSDRECIATTTSDPLRCIAAKKNEPLENVDMAPMTTRQVKFTDDDSDDTKDVASAELDDSLDMDLPLGKKDSPALGSKTVFYEDVKVTNDAGEPLMPRSLLDLAVEDEVHENYEHGNLLWRKFREAAASNCPFTCKSVIDSWVAEGNMPSRRVLIHTILALRSWRKAKRARELFDWVMGENLFELTELDYAVYLDLIGKINGAKQASKYYTEIPESCQTSMVYSALLATFIEHGMEKGAVRLLSRARNRGLAGLVFLYNQLLFFYKCKGRISDVADLLKEMEDCGVDANLHTYNIALDLRARKGDVAGMHNVWKCLGKEENIRPDAASYAILARGYINAGMCGKAESAIRRLEASPYRRKEVVYRWLLKLYARLKRGEDLERIWNLLKHISKALVDDYSIMIEAVGKAGDLAKAEDMFKEVGSKVGIKRQHQYHALISVYLNHGKIDKAEDMLEKMSQDWFNCGSGTYHELIETYTRNGDTQKAIETLQKAQKAAKSFSGHKVWYGSYLTVLELLGEQGDVENAELVIKALKGSGYPCGFQVYGALLKAYVKANMKPYGFLDRMRFDGAIPNSHIRIELSKLGGT